jgi:hypothetical protein
MIVASVEDLSAVAPGVEVDVEIEAREGDDAADSAIRVVGDGFVSSSVVEVTMHSDPVLLGTITADADGTFETTMALPADAESGEHRIILVGETADGTLSSSWHFAIDPAGVIERIGDPPPPAHDAPAASAEVATAAAAAAAAAGDTQGDADAATPDAPVAVLAAATVDTSPGQSDVVVIDDRTGLPQYTPVSEPEETVDDAVEAFALVSLLGAGGSMALGVGALTSGGAAAAAAGGAAGVAAGGRSSDGSGGGDGSDGGDGEKKRGRGKGKVASAKAKKMGDIDQRAAWGDRSRTWRLPATAMLDQVLVRSAERVQPASPLAARMMSDGSTVRAVVGSGWLLAPLLGVVLAIVALGDTGGQAIAPSFALMAALLVLGVADASGGFAAVATFWTGVVVSGGIESSDDVRSMLGITTLWFAVPLIASAIRPFRRPPNTTWDDRWKGISEIAVGSMLAAWTVQSVVKSLPGLSGLDQPISGRADQLALIALGALVGRYVLERLAVAGYPERLTAATFEPQDKPGSVQQTVSLVVKTAMFAFVILPYVGNGWPLWVVAAMSFVPSFAGIWKKSFPNSGALYRVLPRGIPNTLMMMSIGTVLGSVVSERFEDPATLLMASFVILAIPGFVLGAAGLFGRDGTEPQSSWQLRLAGLWVAAVAVAKIFGLLGDSVVVPLALVSPLAVWWLVASTIAARQAATADDQTDDAATEPGAESAASLNELIDPAVGVIDDTLELLRPEITPDVRWSVGALADEGLWIDAVATSDDPAVGADNGADEVDGDEPEPRAGGDRPEPSRVPSA